MKTPTKEEKAAIEAAFSLGNRQTKKRTFEGWSFMGSILIDDAGNTYEIDEIRAIFYTRRLLRYYESKISALSKPRRAPEAQMTFAFMRTLPHRGKK
jgi:hypothetical protein